MNRSEIEAKLGDLLVQELKLDREKIKPGASFEKDLEVDSLGVVELLMVLEDAFGVSIADQEAKRIVKVSDAVDLLARKLGA